jgi:hypothetical protein
MAFVLSGGLFISLLNDLFEFVYLLWRCTHLWKVTVRPLLPPHFVDLHQLKKDCLKKTSSTSA